MTATVTPIHMNVTKATLPSSLTTFIRLPSAILLSLAYEFLFLDPACSSPLPVSHSKEIYSKRSISLYQLSSHPSILFKDYQKEWSKLLLTKQQGYSIQHDYQVDDYWLRIDIRNRTRLVNHHFLSEIDGHKRRYFMHIETPYHLSKIYTLPGSDSKPQTDLLPLPAYFHSNNHFYSSVYLLREMDNSMIPYEHVYGVTLIFALRLHLHLSQRELLYKKFLQLPLYEDMASWNILITGNSLSYIDYDTQTQWRSTVLYIYKIYVLFNYSNIFPKNKYHDIITVV